MKIAFFSVPLLNYGGGFEKHLIIMANEMARRNHKVSIINLSEKFYFKFNFLLKFYYRMKSEDNLRFSNDEINSKLKNVEWIVGGFDRIREKIKGFDVIYSKNEIIDLLTF